MKKLALKLFFLAVPFIIAASIIIKIDPYNYFSDNSKNTDTKKNISYRLNYSLWKIIEYKRNPLPNILLGDSQMESLRSDDIFEITGQKFYNFSYGGGLLPEMINTFWFAAETTRLKNVYFGISFNHFNAYNNNKDRVTSARQIIDNPLLYLVNRNVLNATIHLVKYKFTESITQIERPPVNRLRFWTHKLNYPTNLDYAQYIYPKTWYQDLRRISEYCRDRDINLKIIILPTHTQLQAKVQEFNLFKEYEVYLEDLAKLAVIYDFNYNNHWTEDESNFKDPRHFKQRLARELIREIWGIKRSWARITSSNNY